MRERNMRQNRIQFKAASFRQLPIVVRMARLSLLAAAALGMAVSLSPETARAQEYPWCVSRESYLYCFYKTQEQCQWTASGMGGCALNPRLLFPNKPRDSIARLRADPKPIEPDASDVIPKGCVDRPRALRRATRRESCAHQLHSRTPCSLSRPAPFCKDQSSRVGSATEQACHFECFVSFRAWGHHACKLQGICGEVIPTKPVG